MKNFFKQWDNLKKELSDKHIMLFLDYDGTLAPIAETPDKAVISEETKRLLKRLSERLRYSVAIISGRALSDIKNIVGLKNIFYVGNHGLEIEGPKIKFESQVSLRLKEIIHNIYEEMIAKLSKIRGVIIEDKGLSISIHYRLVDNKDLSELRHILDEITEPFLACDKIKITEGKKVFEIRPPAMWDKGKVVLWLLARQQFVSQDKDVFPIYIGDDVSDEDAFEVLKRKGLTIFVGEPKSSSAEYYLKDTKGVTRFLHFMLELKNK